VAGAGLCLTQAELVELTGRRTRPAMIRALRSMGLEFRVAGDGWPRVDRAHYARIMRGELPRPRRRAEPRFDAVREEKLA
jgi:hypothetical protein